MCASAWRCGSAAPRVPSGGAEMVEKRSAFEKTEGVSAQGDDGHVWKGD